MAAKISYGLPEGSGKRTSTRSPQRICTTWVSSEMTIRPSPTSPVLAEEHPPLTVKAFDKPIHYYKVVGIYDDLVEEGKIIRKEQDGVRVMVDLTKQDKSGAIRTIEEVLSQREDSGRPVA